MRERLTLIDPCHKSLSIRSQCRLLEINRSSHYYKPKGESPQNLELMRLMDKLFLEDPTLGVLGMQDELLDKGLNVSPSRIRRLARKMGIEPIYPKRNLSKPGKAKYIRPYLLRDMKIDRPNEAWAIDITCIPMHKGFMYLTAIIDIYSRYIVGWQITNSMEKEIQTDLVEEATGRHGCPEIINSDQGSQYTGEHWTSYLKEKGIKISMDGKGRATDNAFIERFFRTLKQKHIYLNPARNGLELHAGVSAFMAKYNLRRHRGIDRQRPSDRYHSRRAA